MACDFMSESLVIDGLQLQLVHGNITKQQYLDELHERFQAGDISVGAWKQGLHQVALPLTSHAPNESVTDEFINYWQL